MVKDAKVVPEASSAGNHDVNLAGVSYRLLEKLRDLAVEQDPDMLTSGVCESFIKPWTDATRANESALSFHEFMHAKHASPPSSRFGPLGMNFTECFGPSHKATVFISHAWKYRFVDLVSAISAFVRDQKAKGDMTEHYFWVDLFVNNQHGYVLLPFEWWSTTFKEAIRAIGHTCVVMAPFLKPMPLTRAWCLWEIACTLDTQSSISIQFSDVEREHFEEHVTADFNVCLEVLCNVHVQASEARSSDDRNRILKAVEKLDNGNGYHHINKKVTKLMRRWLVKTAQDLLVKLQHNASAADVGADAGAGGERVGGGGGGGHHEKLYAMMNAVASVLAGQGKDAQAVDLYRSATDGYSQLEGPGSENSVKCSQNLASALVGLGDEDSIVEAGALYQQGLAVRAATLGVDDPLTLISKFNLGTWYFEEGRMSEACDALQEVHDTRARVLGPAHEDTMSTKTSLASVYSAMERYEEAETYYEDILAHHTRLSSHTLHASEGGGGEGDTLLQAGVLDVDALHLLGEFSILLHAVGKFERAAAMSSRCVKGYEKVYGDKAETTAWAQYNLACILDDVGDPVQALAVCEKCLRAFESPSMSQKNGERDDSRFDSVHSLRDSLLKRSVTVKKASGLGKLKAIVKLLVTGRRRRHGEGSGDRASAGEGAGGKGLWKGTKDSLKVRRAESRVLVANDDDDDDGLFDYTSVW